MADSTLDRVERKLAERMSHELRRAQVEHDKRVEEYSELAKLLPHGMELSAMRCAVTKLREAGHPYIAEFLATYVERLAKAGRTGY